MHKLKQHRYIRGFCLFITKTLETLKISLLLHEHHRHVLWTWKDKRSTLVYIKLLINSMQPLNNTKFVCFTVKVIPYTGQVLLMEPLKELFALRKMRRRKILAKRFYAFFSQQKFSSRYINIVWCVKCVEFPRGFCAVYSIRISHSEALSWAAKWLVAQSSIWML